VIPLSVSDDKFELMVFGGRDSTKEMDFSKIFTSHLSNFENSEFTETDPMPGADRLYYNQHFQIPEAAITSDFLEQLRSEKKRLLTDLRRPRSQLIGVMSRDYFHVFDK